MTVGGGKGAAREMCECCVRVQQTAPWGTRQAFQASVRMAENARGCFYSQVRGSVG